MFTIRRTAFGKHGIGERYIVPEINSHGLLDPPMTSLKLYMLYEVLGNF
jgi:hypothetical protein